MNTTHTNAVPTELFSIGEIVEYATYVQNDGWKWLGGRMTVTQDDGGALVKGDIKTRQGEWWEIFRREHVRSIRTRENKFTL